jgi:protein-disulfide isomerase
MENNFNENFEVELAQVKSKSKEVFDKTKLILPGAILVAALLISGSVVFSSLSTDSNGVNNKQNGDSVVGGVVDVSIDDDPMLGNSKAGITLIEFSDFQCLFCRRFWNESLQQIKKEYIDTGKVRLVYRDYPLSALHPSAQISAEASECADEQGKFWEMHDKIFKEQAKQGTGTVAYEITDLKTWASQIGLDKNKFNQCLDSGKYKTEVEKDLADGSSYGVSGTPAFILMKGNKTEIDTRIIAEALNKNQSIVPMPNGNYFISGAQPFSTFKGLIDEELKQNEKDIIISRYFGSCVSWLVAYEK